MNTIPIEGETRRLGEMQGYIGLSILDQLIDDTVSGPNTPAMLSAWLPTPEEAARIAAGAPIYLRVVGSTHPPVMLIVGDVSDVKREIADVRVV